MWGEDTSADGGTGVIGASNNGVGVVAAGATADLVADGSGTVLFRGTRAHRHATLRDQRRRHARSRRRRQPVVQPVRRRLGPARSTASVGGAGTLHVIAPVRVYDSRLPTPTQGKLATGEHRIVSVADARNEVTGLVTTADIVPDGATAVVANLTVTETEGNLGGFLSVVPGWTRRRSAGRRSTGPARTRTSPTG